MIWKWRVVGVIKSNYFFLDFGFELVFRFDIVLIDGNVKFVRGRKL